MSSSLGNSSGNNKREFRLIPDFGPRFVYAIVFDVALAVTLAHQELLTVVYASPWREELSKLPDLKLPFGVRNGALVHISEIAEANRGGGCGCVCPSCHEPLIARIGRIGGSRRPHFAHSKSAECQYAVETALHLAAKAILRESLKIRLPAIKVRFQGWRPDLPLAPEQTYDLESVELETRVGGIVPDLIAYYKGHPLLIEIAVTHRVEVVKLQKTCELGLPMIEIDLSSASRDFTQAELASLIVDDVSHKQWIHNPKVDDIRRRIVATGERKKTVARGWAVHVDECPITARRYKGKPYANYRDDCMHCNYILEFDDEDEGARWITCGGKHKVVTVADLVNFERSRSRK